MRRAALAAVALLLGACGGGDADDPAPDVVGEPTGYRITYEITDAEGRVTTEEVAVLRPFVSEQVLSEDGTEVSSSRTALGRLLLPEGVLAIAPAMAGADLRLLPVLDAAIDEGLLARRASKTVAGRSCRVYRAGSSVIAGELAEGGPTDASHADACFDDSGLLLEERWVVDGDVLRTKVATAVEVGDVGSLGVSWADAPPSLPGGGGSFAEVGERIATADVPDGFDHLGTFATELPGIAGGRESTSEVWVRGIDVLIVEVGASPGDGDVAPFVVSLRGVEVRDELEDGRLLRVLGTLAPDDVRAFAQSVELAR